MILICPSCGIRLEKDFKFCPNCGYDILSADDEIRTSSGGSIDEGDNIICEICGEENSKENHFCSSCGAKLKSHADSKIEKTVPSIPDLKSQTPKKKKNIPSKTPTISSDKTAGRGLSQLQVISIVAAALGITLILLITSGVFDSTSTNTTMRQMPQENNPSSGVDLTTLNEINSLEEKIKANPDDTQSLLHLAHLKNDSGLYDQAIQTYKEYLGKHPEDADARVDMGVCYYNLRDYPTAIAEMKKALEYKSDHQIAHLNLGIVNLTAGNLDESKKWFQRAVDIDPNSEVGKRAKELLQSH